MADHSKIVGGSTAKRVINCPGSVPLVQKMPPQVESKYAAEGTMLHAAVEDLLADGEMGDITAKYALTPEQAEKLQFCLEALDQIDPDQKMTFVQEMRVEFTSLPGVFGHADLLGRLGPRAIVLDWKFGDGVIVDAEESEQGLFYAAAAMETRGLEWVFKGATEIEIVIVQSPAIRRWVTTPERVAAFKRDLDRAVALASKPDAPMAMGDWCRWCTAKPICPLMTGAIERLEHNALEAMSPQDLGRALALADKLESFIEEARKIAFGRLEKGMPVDGYKLVPKQARRQWVKPDEAAAWLTQQGVAPYKQELLSPAQAETALKKSKTSLPADMVASVSSGNTIAPESDPRPAVMVIGERLKAALSRVQ